MDELPNLYVEAVRLLKEKESFKNCNQMISTMHKESDSAIWKKLTEILRNLYFNITKFMTIIDDSGLLKEHKDFCPHLAQVLTCVLVLYGSPTGGHESIKIFNRYREKMLESAVKHEITVTKEYVPAVYVKVDTAKKEMEFVHSELKKEGYKIQKYDDGSSYESFLELVKNLDVPYYLVDYHIKDMLIFPAGIELRGTPLHQQKIITHREKESFIRLLLSGVCENSKAIHISETASYSIMLDIVKKMKNNGNVVVFENMKKKRAKFRKFLLKDGVSGVTYPEEGFLETEPSQYQDIEYVLLTPRSSQSGMRPKNDVNTEKVDNQISYLNHALSLPNVQEVLYSTNSILKEENEEVVKQALLKYEDDFTLADLSSEIKDWKNFGLPSYEFGSQCLRLDPSTDFCPGAFFAKFVRNNKENSNPKGKRKISNKQSPSKKMKTAEAPAKKKTKKRSKKGKSSAKKNKKVV